MNFQICSDISIPENWEKMYERIQPFSIEDVSGIGGQSILLIEKPEKKEISNVSYLWKKTPKEDFTDLDNKFVNILGKDERKNWEQTEYYGLHTYGGYYGFFRPDLMEVIKLISMSPPVLEEGDIIYVTTKCCSSEGDLSMSPSCYNVQEDRHYAKTSILILKR